MVNNFEKALAIAGDSFNDESDPFIATEQAKYSIAQSVVRSAMWMNPCFGSGEDMYIPIHAPEFLVDPFVIAENLGMSKNKDRPLLKGIEVNKQGQRRAVLQSVGRKTLDFYTVEQPF